MLLVRGRVLTAAPAPPTGRQADHTKDQLQNAEVPVSLSVALPCMETEYIFVCPLTGFMLWPFDANCSTLL